MKAKYIISAAILAGMTATAHAEGEVNVLTWEGYADPSFIDQFEAESGCTVTATYVGSNDDFAPKLLAGGGVYDLITPSIDTTDALHEAHRGPVQIIVDQTGRILKVETFS